MEYKLSKYNYTLKKDDDTFLCINLVSKLIFALNREKYELILQYEKSLTLLKNVNSALFSALYKLGFIVDSEIDEFSRVSTEHRRQVYSSSLFRLTIMPTLECNFNCWYCYEEHTKGHMNTATKKAIQKYLDRLFSTREISSFQLDWFGGEPLLYFDIVYDISKKVKEITNRKDILFSNTITTNGALITDEMLRKFSEIDLTNFQITIDGSECVHNKIKNNKSGRNEYKVLIENILRLCDGLDAPNITIRVNYTSNTLKDISSIIEDIPKNYLEKIKFTFQQVWQTLGRDIHLDIDSVIKEFEKAGAIVNKPNLSPLFYRCYADVLSQAVITHQGKVFKCTARDFAHQQPDGLLQPDGSIDWTNTYYERTSKTTVEAFTKCKTCNFLPACLGPCSQKVLECRSELDFPKICNYDGYKATVDGILLEYSNNL